MLSNQSAGQVDRTVAVTGGDNGDKRGDTPGGSCGTFVTIVTRARETGSLIPFLTFFPTWARSPCLEMRLR
jgi:hypothetical protein